MHSVKFVGRIQYNTVKSNSLDIEFFARDKNEAKILARELFQTEKDSLIASDIQVGVKYVKPTEAELNHIQQVMKEVYEPLKETLEGKGYDSFLRFYLEFQGYDFIKDEGTASFYIKFKNITLKIVYDGQTTKIDDEEIIYYSITQNREYVILDNGVTVLIGS